MIKKADKTIKEEVKRIFIEQWKTDFMVSKSKIYYVEDLEALVYLESNQILGLLTFSVTNQEMEIVSLDSFQENKGIGSALINEAISYFKINKLHKLWLITTNDNLHALKFYQKRNFSISNFYPNAIEKSRLIKPSIPKIGYDDIPLQHEIELTYNNGDN